MDQPLEHAAAFMRRLLATVPESSYVLLWTLADKTSHWEPASGGPDVIAARAVALSKNSDVYVGVSTVDVPGTRDRRTSNENSAGVFGVWADIDIADPDIHQKWNLPPDLESANKILEECGLPPSLVVHSGHGLQAWWLFHDFFAFDDGDDRRKMYDLAKRWNHTLRTIAARHQWTLDSVFDLGRVMRVPGTVNRKGEPFMQVQFTSDSGKSYTFADIESHCVELNSAELREAGISPVNEYQVGDLLLGLDRALSVLERDTMWDNSSDREKVEQSYNWARPDKPDWTGSEYDQSNASLAIKAESSDQQAWDYVTMSRVKNAKNKTDREKVLRLDYAKSTLRKAHNDAAEAKAPERLDEAIETLERVSELQDPDAEREARRSVFGEVGVFLGNLTIVNFQRYLSTDRMYALVLPTGEVNFPRFSDFDDPRRARALIIDQTGVWIPHQSRAQWDSKIVKRLLHPKVREDVDLGEEVTEKGRLKGWLAEYLNERDLTTLALAQEALAPWRDSGGGVHLFTPSFQEWVTRFKDQRTLTAPQLNRMLRQAGCQHSSTNITDRGGKRTQRPTWLIHPDLWSPSDTVVD